jgi:hypothetical protein
MPLAPELSADMPLRSKGGKEIIRRNAACARLWLAVYRKGMTVQQVDYAILSLWKERTETI